MHNQWDMMYLVREVIILQEAQGHHSGGLVASLHVFDEFLYVPEFRRRFRLLSLKISVFFFAFRLLLVI